MAGRLHHKRRIAALIAAEGLEIVDVRQSNHLVYRVRLNGEERSITFSASPRSDHRWENNASRVIRLVKSQLQGSV